MPLPVVAWSGTRWAPAPSEDVAGESFDVVTLNVWFDEHERTRRTSALLSRLEDPGIDIVCLQEVTRSVLRSIEACGWVREEMQMVSSIGSYGLVVLSRLPLRGAFEIELMSAMDRKLLCVELADATVGTVHLESTRALRGARAQQLSQIFEALDERAPAVLCGDFNFDPREPEEEAIDTRTHGKPFVPASPASPRTPRAIRCEEGFTGGGTSTYAMTAF